MAASGRPCPPSAIEGKKNGKNTKQADTATAADTITTTAPRSYATAHPCYGLPIERSP